MKRIKTFFIFLSVFILFCQCSLLSAQFTSEEISQREKIEIFLKTAEIVKWKDIGEGVTKPKKLYLKSGETEIKAVWKNPKGMQKGFLEGWQFEIAAYCMDKLLGLNMIPPTVEREFNGKRGSLQYWVEAEMSDLDRMEMNIKIPEEAIINWNKAKYLQRAFDSLIANDDRTQQNILYTKDWRMILIDHSRSFYCTKEYTSRLVFGKNGLKGRKMIRMLPRAFVERIKALDFDSIRKAVGPYLKDKEINGILKRKELLLKEIEEMIKEKGEENFLY
ncbi:MAG: hypothetical protein ACE5LC_05260 [Candidatus Aminicenantales bacterium]